jgi:hypothetical protein
MAARQHYDVPSGSDDGQRPCARGEWCEDAVLTRLEDGTVRRDGALGYRAFCERDRARIIEHLDELPRLYADLAAEIGRPSSGTQQVRAPFGPRIPLRADVDALMRTMEEVLSSWHERTAAVARLGFPEGNLSRRRRPGFAISQAVLIIGAHIDALLALGPEPVRRTVSHQAAAALPPGTPGTVRPGYAAVIADLSGADAGLEILHLHYLARSILGETRAAPQELLGVPCRREECDLRALRRAELPSDPSAPAWWSECSACGDRMNEAEYADWTRRYARWAQGRTVPAITVPALENLPGMS